MGRQQPATCSRRLQCARARFFSCSSRSLGPSSERTGQTLPRAARRGRHAAVARFLEETTGEVGQSHEALAHHYKEAGDLDRAVEHFIAAGDQAGRGWAKERAVALYRKGLGLVPEDDGRRRDIGRRLAVALQALYHVPDAEHLRKEADPVRPATGSAGNQPA